MSFLFEKGREGFLDGTLDWDTQTFKWMLMKLAADTGVKAITGATNATPIVVTATAHGFSNGDFVWQDEVGGNASANGYWKIANVTTNTYELQRPDGTNVAGSGTYTSGGWAVCLGPSTAGDNLDDFDACRIGTDVTMASPTVTSGVADAADPTFTTPTAGNACQAIGLYRDTGTASTSRMVSIHTGKHIVTVASDAALSATTVWVEPLVAGISSGSVLVFSNGASATLSSAASAGARSIAVNSLAAAITAGNRALAPATGSGLPITTNGNNIAVTLDNGANKIFRL